MIKLAVIFESSPFDRKGLFNAVHNRIQNLLATGECQVDAFCVHSWDTDFTRRVRHTPVISERSESVEVEGITYRMLWYDFSIVDDLLVEKLHLRPFYFARFMKRVLPLLQGYDCIAAHSFSGGLIAQAASERYGIPYYVTWHGSEVHTHPFRNPLKLRDTASVMKGAACNFFVSGALMAASEKIVASGSSVAGSSAGGGSAAGICRKEVLYNGVAEEFIQFPDHCRDELRLNNGLAEGDRVVAFVGSIVAVKNVSVLLPLFREISARYAEAVHGPDGPDGAGGSAGAGSSSGLKFWMVGDGKLRDSVVPAMIADTSIDVSFWGNVPSEHMPSVMNCIDVMVLPSLNEGLPLVCAEAIRCGAAVVGSDVGGNPEVIGRDFVVPLGPDFVSEMASKVVSALLDSPVQSVPAALDWKTTASRELSFIKSL